MYEKLSLLISCLIIKSMPVYLQLSIFFSSFFESVHFLGS